MVIIPADLEGAYNGLLNAVKHGDLTRARVDESVMKILRLKASVGLDRDRFVDIAKVTSEVGRPEYQQQAQIVADRAITLISDASSLLPLTTQAPGAGLVTVIFTDNARSSEGGRALARQLKQKFSGATVLFVDDANAAFVGQEVMRAVNGASRVIAVAETVPTARRTTHAQAGGSAGLDQGGADLFTMILQSAGKKTVLVAFGSPYVGVGLPSPGSYLCTFSNTPDSATSLVRALLGEIPIHGKTPVSIPHMAQRGDGLDRPATTAHDSASGSK